MPRRHEYPTVIRQSVPDIERCAAALLRLLESPQEAGDSTREAQRPDGSEEKEGQPVEKDEGKDATP